MEKYKCHMLVGDMLTFGKGYCSNQVRIEYFKPGQVQENSTQFETDKISRIVNTRRDTDTNNISKRECTYIDLKRSDLEKMKEFIDYILENNLVE